MKLDVPGIPMEFADVKPGTFFTFWGKEQAFGLVVTGGRENAAIMFYERDGRPGMPWFAEGGLPRGVVAFPDAIIRPFLSSGSSFQTAAVGAVAHTDKGASITCHSDADGYLTFNLETGMHQDGAEGVTGVSYSRWQVGVIVDDRFFPIYSFPTATRATSS
jgi:hypothetical protein